MLPIVLLQTSDGELASKLEAFVATIDGVRVTHVRAADETIDFLSQNPDIPLVILHLSAEQTDGHFVELVRAIRRRNASSLVFTISDDCRPERDCALCDEGVLECFTRPLNVRRFASLVDLATIKARCNQLPTGEGALDEPVDSVGTRHPFLYGTESMRQLVQQVHMAATTSATLLLTGETGCGKTMLAGLIHELSSRSSQPFVVMNCGSVSPSLVESELFGHRRGAFTGATADRIGKLAAAGTGTLMIDEIDSLPLTAQARLLRACDERVFEALGSDRPVPLRARLVVASNRSLPQEVRAGRFRADLFYRINVVSLHLPPLRERRSLIKPLAAQFLDEFARRYERPVHSMDNDAMRTLRAYDWPGNVRELRNVIERSVALSPTATIPLDALPDEIRCGIKMQVAARTAPKWLPTKATLDVHAIRETLQRTNNNRARAAAELGISRVTLYKKLHKYGLIQTSVEGSS